jgi:hypothetical protein
MTSLTACCPPSSNITVPIQTSTGAIKGFVLDDKDITAFDCTKSTEKCGTAGPDPVNVIPFSVVKPLCGDAAEKMITEICGADVTNDKWVKLTPWWFWVVFGLIVLAMIISMIGMFVK